MVSTPAGIDSNRPWSMEVGGMTGSNGLQSATPVGGATILSRRAMSTLMPFFMVGSKGRGLDPMIQASVAS
jgi:hypothetical protein